MTLNQRVPGSSPGAQPATDSSLAEGPFLRPFLACGGLRFPVSAQGYRLQVPFGPSVSGGKNPVPNSTSQESAGGGEVVFLAESASARMKRGLWIAWQQGIHIKAATNLG